MKSLLKILVVASIAIAFVHTAKAQYVERKYDTLKDASTKSYNYLSAPDVVKGYQVTFNKVSGTVAGTAFLQARIDSASTNWVSISDTLTLANVATQTKIWKVPDNAYTSYRIQVITTGTQATVAKIAQLRRNR